MKETKKFSDLVEEIKLLDKEEKEELKNLLEKYIIEERREKILENYKDSLKEVEKGELNFSKDIGSLKKELAID